MTEEVDSEIGNVKINKYTRLILFLSTAAILGLVIYFDYFPIEKPGELSQLLCKVAFVSSFFVILNYLFPSSEKKAHSEKRTHYIIIFILLALCLLFVPIQTNRGDYVGNQLLFSEHDLRERINLDLLFLQLILVLIVPASLLYAGTELPKIEFYRLTKSSLNFKKLSFGILITSICLPVLFAPHEYQHRGNTTKYYKSKTKREVSYSIQNNKYIKSNTLAREQLLILYRPLFTIPDPKASIGRTSMFGSGNFYVYHQRLRVDLLLLYWLLIVLLSGATFFGTRQKRVGK